MSSLELLPTGHKLDRYEVIDVLGQGGMAVVYRVRHEQLGSLHALKVVAVPSRSVLQRLVQEGRAQARVRHRNIVAVHDVIEVDGSPGLVMEYVAGPSLDVLIRSVRLPLTTIDALAVGILRGVAAAHEGGLVHRDLKPANVLVSIESDGLIPKVADFGLAKDFLSGEQHTRTGAFMGTPNYMAPEQIRDARSVDVRSDVFALGAILYELVTASRAFEGGDVLDVFNRITQGRYPPVASLRPDAPARMIDAIDRALSVEREARPDDVEALLAIWSGGAAQPAPSLDALEPGLLAEVRRLVSLPPPSTRGSAPSPQAGETLALSMASLDVDATPDPVPARRRSGRSAVMVTGLSLTALIALFVGLQTMPRSVFLASEPAAVPGTIGKDDESPDMPVAEPAGGPSGDLRTTDGAPPAPVPVSTPRPGPAPRPASARPDAIRGEGKREVRVGSNEAEPADEPSLADQAEPRVTVRVEGAVSSAELAAVDGTRWPLGPVPAGTYELRVVFRPGDDPIPALEVVLSAAEPEVTVDCDPVQRFCARR